MSLFYPSRKLARFASCESGVTLLETLVALAVLAAIAVGFLSGLATTSKAAIVSDEQSTAKSLAGVKWSG